MQTSSEKVGQFSPKNYYYYTNFSIYYLNYTWKIEATWALRNCT